MQRLIEQFKAKTAHGQEVTILKYVDVIPTPHLGNPNAVIFGKLATLKTTEGYLVSQIDDSRFAIVELGIEITKMT